MRILGAALALLTTAALTACGGQTVSGTPTAAPGSGGGGDPGRAATLWTQYGPTTVTDATDVASLGRTVLWLDAAGRVWTAEPAAGGIAPAAVAGLPDGIVDIDGVEGNGSDFTAAAVDKDGAVWMWGHVVGADASGPFDTTVTAPKRIEGVSGARTVAVGPDVTFAVTASGTVVSWGKATDYGLLGREVDQASVPQAPAELAGLTGVTDVAAGFPAVLALTGDGAVWGWGSNNYSLLAPGDATAPDVPTLLPQLHDIVAVDSDDFTAYAVTRSGSVLAWGDGTSGALGDRAVEKASIDAPVTVAGVDGAVSLSAGASGAMAVGRDGSVHVWGAYAVPDGKGGVTDNDAGSAVTLSWVTGSTVSAVPPREVQQSYAFLVR